MKSKNITPYIFAGLTILVPVLSYSQGAPIGEKGNFNVTITQKEIDTTDSVADKTLTQIQKAGRDVFTTSFNRYDGRGDGPLNKSEKMFDPGNRPTLPANPLQATGNILRINGLDSQSCVECHSFVSTNPLRLGVGGVGGLAATAFPGVSKTDPGNFAKNDYAAFNGRIINPPFTFGSGAVELLAKEMTKNLRAQADDKLDDEKYGKDNPFPLMSHGISFGKAYWREATKAELEDFAKIKAKDEEGPDFNNCSARKIKPLQNEAKPTVVFGVEKPIGIKSLAFAQSKASSLPSLETFIAPRISRAISGRQMMARSSSAALKSLSVEKKAAMENMVLDTSMMIGVNADLIVKPFGRKGNNVTTRDFDCGAIRFHQGMEPVEVVGEDQDNDKDGVVNEVTVGQMSALAIFNTTLAPSCQIVKKDVTLGEANFAKVGCANCHVPVLNTKGTELPYSYPELPSGPFENVYRNVDLGNVNNLLKPDGSKATYGYKPSGKGIAVELFSDLRLHDMGARLQETFIKADETKPNVLDNRTFITARLWGVADTAPYLHDGRAETLTEAIDWHDGEAALARNRFFQLKHSDRVSMLEYLRTLRTPGHPSCPLTNSK